MHNKGSRILAVDPGTREMGLALFEKKALIYHGVKSIRNRESPDRTINDIRKNILRLINDFHPEVMLVEKTFIGRNRNSSLLNVVADEIKVVGKRKGLWVETYAPNTVRKIVCGSGRSSKIDVAKVVAARYPELGLYISQDRRWKERYWQNMFDAVALGMAWINGNC